MPVIPLTNIEIAHARWCHHFQLAMDETAPILDDSFKAYTGLDDPDHLGVTWADGGRGELVTVPDKAARIIELLCSPNHRTILKAIEAKHHL